MTAETAQLLDNSFVECLMLMNLLTATGWVHLTYYNVKLKRGRFQFYCAALATYFIIVAFIHYDAYVFHQGKIIWDLFGLRILATIIALIATFGFVVNADLYEPSRHPTTLFHWRKKKEPGTTVS